MHAKVDSENVSDSNEYFQKVKTVEILVSFWGMLQIGNSIIICEVLNTIDDGNKDNFLKQSLAISTLTSIGLTISIFLRHITHLKWKRSKLYCLKDETIWSSGYWKIMIIEAIFTTIAPQFFFNNITVSEYISRYDVVVTYELNTILCSFVWMKCYVIIRSLLTMTKFLAPRAQRICKMNGCGTDLMFSVQGEFKQSPNTILISTLIISVLIFGYNLRIFESPLSEVSGQRFDSYYTACWCTMVTMTTVGYGDVFPKTTFGRLVGVWICLWGVLLVSLFVVSISDALKMNAPQRNAFNLIQRLLNRDKLKNEAAGAILSRYRIRSYLEKSKSLMNQQMNFKKILEKAEINFKKRMVRFKDTENEIRGFDTATETTYVNKGVEDLMETVETISKEKDEMIRKQENIWTLLRIMIKHIDY